MYFLRNGLNNYNRYQFHLYTAVKFLMRMLHMILEDSLLSCCTKLLIFSSFLELSFEAEASTTVQYLNSDHEMSVSQVSHTMTVSPFDKVNQQFNMTREFDTLCLNVPPQALLNSNNYTTLSMNLVTFFYLTYPMMQQLPSLRPLLLLFCTQWM